MVETKDLPHVPVIQRFAVLLKNDRIAHAYLFIGPTGVGKYETALAIAKLVFCEGHSSAKEFFCDLCPPCCKVRDGNHPDLHVVKGEYGQSIKIAEIRELISRMQLRPYEAKKKILIMRNIENLTMESGNALLKTLEEPSANSLILLTSSVPEEILDTVRSRCHVVYFGVLPPSRIRERLVEQCRVKKETAHFLAYLSEGSWGKAVDLGEQDIYARKDAIIDYFIRPQNDEIFQKTILADKEKTKESLDVFLGWLRDLMLIKAGAAADDLINKNRIGDLKAMAEGLPMDSLNDIVAEIVKAKKCLNDNLNVKIALSLMRERILMK